MKEEKIETKMRFLETLFESSQELNATIVDLDELMTKIMMGARKICDVEAASLLLFDSKGKELSFRIALGEKGEEIKRLSLPAEEGIAGWVAKHGEPLIINDVGMDPRFSDRFDKQTGFRSRSILCIPIFWKDKVLGVIEVINKSNQEGFSKIDQENLTIFAQQTAIALHNSKLLEELQDFFVNTIEVLVEAIEAVDHSSEGHLLRVARLATGIAREMNLEGDDYRKLYYASMIHDIGRLKRKGLDQFHPLLGAEMIGSIILLKEMAEIIKFHHERYDGSGYPQGLRGEEIPLLARILSLAEVYDEAMIGRIEDREFRERFTVEFLEKIESFGPKLGKVFSEAIQKGLLESIYG